MATITLQVIIEDLANFGVLNLVLCVDCGCLAQKG
jgi:hypothetical protein